jgi:malate dehydrogenase (oxaloacetate-decarboxylating)(NADP+)
LSLEEQATRVLANFRALSAPLDRYIFATALQDRNETLFYRVLIDQIEELMPVVYTPTVGEACRRFGQIFRRPRGLYFSIEDRGRATELLANWPEDDVAIVVVTDGERILGLGDLGAYGMGIPIGKLALYTACAGVHPAACLPVQLDVGTDNERLLGDSLYTGVGRRRIRGSAYYDFVEEFITAVAARYPGVVIQFEDFATEHAIELLKRYRDRLPCFNDDIQGTAAVTLAGLLAAARLTGRPLEEERLLFFGAGSAATGIADLVVAAMMRRGLREKEARQRCWFVDSKGLVTSAREDLASHKRPYAHHSEPATNLFDAVRVVRPTGLLGLSTQPQTFTEPILREIARINTRPIVFALSNPTSQAECTAEQAYRWTDGRAVYASGSPFDPVELDSHRFVPGQGNNAYIFPGVGLGVIVAKATRITDSMFLAAADTLARLVDDRDLSEGTLFPRLTRIREVSAEIARAVVEVALSERVEGRAVGPDPMATISRRSERDSSPESQVELGSNSVTGTRSANGRKSRSLKIPTSRPSSTTGRQATRRSNIKATA